jgi:hypothetical protein
MSGGATIGKTILILHVLILKTEFFCRSSRPVSIKLGRNHFGWRDFDKNSK